MRDLVATLVELLEPYRELRLALLFGSRARGTGRMDSDVDLAVLGHARLSAETRIAIIGDIGAASGWPIDLIDLHGTPEPVTGEALEGVRLLGDDATFADLLSRHLVHVEDFMPLQKRMRDERRSRWLR